MSSPTMRYPASASSLAWVAPSRRRNLRSQSRGCTHLLMRGSHMNTSSLGPCSVRPYYESTNSAAAGRCLEQRNTARLYNRKRTMENLNGLKVAILVDNGFEQVELVEPRRALDQAGAETRIVS